MRVRRLIGSAVATMLAATTLVAAAGATTTTASAAVTVPTRIVAGTDGRSAVYSLYKPTRYGDRISLSINVEGYIDGQWKQIYNGGLTVTEQVVGKKARTVASSTSAYLYDGTPARGNATYTIRYAGGTGGYPTVNYAPTSASYSVRGIQRSIKAEGISGKRAGFKGKITPAAKTKVIVQRKVGKKWKKHKTFRTNAKGRFTMYLPAPKRGKYNWRITFKGNRQFASTTLRGTTQRRFF